MIGVVAARAFSPTAWDAGLILARLVHRRGPRLGLYEGTWYTLHCCGALVLAKIPIRKGFNEPWAVTSVKLHGGYSD